MSLLNLAMNCLCHIAVQTYFEHEHKRLYTLKYGDYGIYNAQPLRMI